MMIPLKGMEGVQSQIWAIHQAMKIAVNRDIRHLEADIIVEFDILSEQALEIILLTPP